MKDVPSTIVDDNGSKTRHCERREASEVREVWGG